MVTMYKGSFWTPFVNISLYGGENYPYKVKGTEIPREALDPLSSCKANSPTGESNLCWYYKGRQ